MFSYEVLVKDSETYLYGGDSVQESVPQQRFVLFVHYSLHGQPIALTSLEPHGPKELGTLQPGEAVLLDGHFVSARTESGTANVTCRIAMRTDATREVDQ